MSLPSYITSCSGCNYKGLISYDTNYKFNAPQDSFCSPSVSWGWCNNCDKVTMIYLPQLSCKHSERLEEIQCEINKHTLSSIGLFYDLKIKLFPQKEKELEMLKRQKERILKEVKKIENLLESNGVSPKCLTCGSEKVVAVQIPECRGAALNLGIAHNCGGGILIQESRRVNYSSIPEVVFDVYGNILVDTRQKIPSKSTHKRSFNFCLIWGVLTIDSVQAKKYGISEFKGKVPYLLRSENYIKYKNKEKFETTRYDLMLGLFYVLKLGRKTIEVPVPDEYFDIYKSLLLVFSKTFYKSDTEQMVLHLSNLARSTCGPLVSCIILEAGDELLAGSSKIKFELIIDTWKNIANGDYEHSRLCSIPAILRDVSIDDVNTCSGQLACYYTVCAIILLDSRNEFSEFIDKSILKKINSEKLDSKIRELIRNPISVRVSSLTVDSLQ